MDKIVPFFPKGRRNLQVVPPEGISHQPPPDPYEGRDLQEALTKYFGCGPEGPFDTVYHAKAAKLANHFGIRVGTVLGWHQRIYPREHALRSCFITIDSLIEAEAYEKERGLP